MPRTRGPHPEHLPQGLAQPAELRSGPSLLQLDLPDRHQRLAELPAPAQAPAGTGRSTGLLWACPEDETHGAQVRDVIQTALQELNEGNRQVILLRHFLNCSHQEMSELLGIPPKTVKSRLFCARQLLEQALRRRGVTTS